MLSWPDCGASLILHRVPGSAGVMDTIILGTDGRVLALRERRDGPSTDHLWTDDTMERGPKGAPKCAAFAAVGGVTYSSLRPQPNSRGHLAEVRKLRRPPAVLAPVLSVHPRPSECTGMDGQRFMARSL